LEKHLAQLGNGQWLTIIAGCTRNRSAKLSVDQGLVAGAALQA